MTAQRVTTVLLATVLLAVSVGEGLAQGLSPQPRPKGSPGESPDESPDESPEESKRLQAPTRPPVRFLLYSISHSGTHFVKHPFDKVPGVSVGNEVFLHELPPTFAGRAQPYMHATNLTELRYMKAADPTWVESTVIPVLELFLGLADLQQPEKRQLQLGGGLVRFKFWQRWHAPLTWAEAQRRLNMQRAVGALWNHNNEPVPSGTKLDRRGLSTGHVWAEESFMEWLRLHDVRVILLERTNGIARVISGSNRKGATGGGHSKLLEIPRPLTLRKLKAEHAAYRERRVALAFAMAACEAAGVAAIRVSYELLVQQPQLVQDLLRFVDVDSKLVHHPNGTTLRDWDPPSWGRRFRWGVLLGDNKTRYHTKSTRSYISNSDRVEGWLRGGQFPEWAVCMLDDQCPLPPIQYTSAATQTLKTEADARSKAATLASRGSRELSYGQEGKVSV